MKSVSSCVIEDLRVRIIAQRFIKMILYSFSVPQHSISTTPSPCLKTLIHYIITAFFLNASIFYLPIILLYNTFWQKHRHCRLHTPSV